jgi:hypothetical protein
MKMIFHPKDDHLQLIQNFEVDLKNFFYHLLCFAFDYLFILLFFFINIFYLLEQRWRDPDLEEVIEYLTHTSDIIKENAAAYLQHLCYNDDNIKSKTRSLNGISYLITLLNHDKVEIQKNACGALRNLCYGKRNDENKV